VDGVLCDDRFCGCGLERRRLGYSMTPARASGNYAPFDCAARKQSTAALLDGDDEKVIGVHATEGRC
jgi:hypothetical protein